MLSYWMETLGFISVYFVLRSLSRTCCGSKIGSHTVRTIFSAGGGAVVGAGAAVADTAVAGKAVGAGACVAGALDGAGVWAAHAAATTPVVERAASLRNSRRDNFCGVMYSSFVFGGSQ
jgi:hypothetical protein